ncbi:unnamed protein product [Merluccius merluccius]
MLARPDPHQGSAFPTKRLVMRVLGVASRVATAFKSARGTNGKLVTEEPHSMRGKECERLSQDGIRPLAHASRVPGDRESSRVWRGSRHLCVTVSDRSCLHRFLREHLSAQLKENNSDVCVPFWHAHRTMVRLHHSLSSSDYQALLTCTDIINVRTKHAVHVSFTNTLTQPLSKAVLTLGGFGLFHDKHYPRAILLQPGQSLEKDLSIMAACPGTKLLMATVSHGNGHGRSPGSSTGSWSEETQNGSRPVGTSLLTSSSHLHHPTAVV